jgi:hypothetical protein
MVHYLILFSRFNLMPSIPGRQKAPVRTPIDAGIIMVSKQDCK